MGICGLWIWICPWASTENMWIWIWIWMMNNFISTVSLEIWRAGALWDPSAGWIVKIHPGQNPERRRRVIKWEIWIRLLITFSLSHPNFEMNLRSNLSVPKYETAACGSRSSSASWCSNVCTTKHPCTSSTSASLYPVSPPDNTFALPNWGLLVVPHYRLSSYGRRAFSVADPAIWNWLPDSLRDPAISRDSFRRFFI